MAVIKQDETFNASYWKAFPMTKQNKADVCLFKDSDNTERSKALKRILVDIDYSTMEYDSSIELTDAVSKFTYEQLKVSKMSEKPEDWDVEEQGEFVPEETNWFADAVDNI